jgi:hypothetical protein
MLFDEVGCCCWIGESVNDVMTMCARFVRAAATQQVSATDAGRRGELTAQNWNMDGRRTVVIRRIISAC